MNFGPPKNFVRHPIADPGKFLLQQKGLFDRKSGMSRENGAQISGLPLLELQVAWQSDPPIRRGGALVKKNPPELARIAKDQTAPGLEEDQVVVWRWGIRGGFDSKFPRHPEVNAQPAVSGKLKEQLFASGF
jgi:hypothetical protein